MRRIGVDLTLWVSFVVDAEDHDSAVVQITHDSIMRAIENGNYSIEDADITTEEDE